MGDPAQSSGVFRTARVSQQRIAEELGLSRQVVSAVLGRSGGGAGTIRFSPETEWQVLTLAQRLGYPTPRSLAVLAEIRVLVENTVTMLSPGLLDALVQACETERVEMALHIVRAGAPSPLRQMPPRHDRVIVAFPAADTDAGGKDGCELAQLQERGHRVLQVNALGRPGARILYDEAGGMALLLTALHAEGRRHAVLPHGSTAWFNQQRLAALREQAAALGMSDGGMVRYDMPDVLGSLTSALAARAELDAVICGHPDLVPYVAAALRHLGRRVPEEVRICTYFTAASVPAYAPGVWCLALEVESLARRLVTVAQAWCGGEDPQLGERHGFTLVR
ncbi:MAG TPA: hypothetical protein DCS97_04310 [Planctomycetes bacterium]|nr:hypothetical protein [Planctomycetota bacterium]